MENRPPRKTLPRKARANPLCLSLALGTGRLFRGTTAEWNSRTSSGKRGGGGGEALVPKNPACFSFTPSFPRKKALLGNLLLGPLKSDAAQPTAFTPRNGCLSVATPEDCAPSLGLMLPFKPPAPDQDASTEEAKDCSLSQAKRFTPDMLNVFHFHNTDISFNFSFPLMICIDFFSIL